MSWPGAGGGKKTDELPTLSTRRVRPPHGKPRVSWSEKLVTSHEQKPSAAAAVRKSAAERYWAQQTHWDRVSAGGSVSAGSRTPRGMHEATESVTSSRAIPIVKAAQGEQRLCGSSPTSSSPPPLSPENSGACFQPPPVRASGYEMGGVLQGLLAVQA
jgi:hypothetical protein